jgi:hypothetical protein
MIINEKEYILSPRKTKDVLDLVEACKNLEESNSSSFVIMAQVICGSLKVTYKKLPFFRRIFSRKVTLKYLLANLSTLEISNAFNEVIELEGGKKKVVVENQSVETLQKEK